MTATSQHHYQLVFQFRCASLEDYDTLVALEQQFISAIRDHAIVDGHDSGCNEFNIFVHTDTPAASFTQLRPMLAAANLLPAVRVAYREFGSDLFSIVWPESDQQPFIIA